MIVDVRTHETLDDYVFLPQETYGITPAVKKSARKVFIEVCHNAPLPDASFSCLHLTLTLAPG